MTLIDRDGALDDWAFNVRLECLGREGPIEVALGGAILDLRDLDAILETALRARGEV